MNIVVYILIGIGLFFNLMSVLGLLRFPDLYTRLHASTKGTTFGALFITIGIVVAVLTNAGYYGDMSVTIIVHSIIAFLVIIFTNPVGSHAIARGAHRSGVRPYGAVVDELNENECVSKNNNHNEKAEAEK